ncbi:MAG: hypothetical protein QM820_51640 [Minicystis sp.]
MRTRWMIAATVIGTMGGFSACATGTDSNVLTTSTTGTGGGTSSSSTASSGGSGGGDGGRGGASASSSSSSTSGSGGASLCGNGVKDPGEQCDGADFGGLTCQLLNLGPGQLVCNGFCSIVATNCSPKENCVNNEDDNFNGLYDCQDPDCEGNAACVDTCTPPAVAQLPGFEFSNTSGRPASHKASCSVASGREIIYQVVAPVDGNLTLTLSSFDADFSLSVRTACGDDTSEIACTNKIGSGSFESEILSVPVLAGQTYFVMVDGNTENDFGSFDLSLDIPLPESDCANLSDDDNDGLVDCDDATSCQTLPECMPGTTATGQACFFNAACTANQNDPICLPDFLGFPGGYCSQFCDQTADDCGAGSICYTGLALSAHGVCMATCTQDTDCRPGYGCVDKGLAQKVCALPPESACNNFVDDDNNGFMDCEDPGCQTSPECAPGSKAAGQPCAANNECFADHNDPICIDPAFGFPNGYCSQFCSMSPDDCGPAGVCTFEGPNGTTVCMQACTTSAQCQAGYNCLDFGYPKKICFP